MGFTKMKKTLAALAVLGAFAGSAAAADVTLYGLVDYGFLYNYDKLQDFTGASESENTFKLESGVDSPSRFGLKGTEDLGNGMQVSFILENGFNGDDGTMGQDSRLFGREASLSLSGAFGTVSFGRMGGVASSAGSYDLVYAIGDAFDGGDNAIIGFAMSDRYDNMVTYQTPAFAGLQLTAQYSFKQDSKDKMGDEGDFSTANRYAGVALTGEYGPAQFVAAWELQKYGHGEYPADARALKDDGNTFYVGGNYDFGVAKVFAMGQYFQHLTNLTINGTDLFGGVDDDAFFETPASLYEGLKGYGLHLGAIVPVVGGDLTVGAYYADYKLDGVPSNVVVNDEGNYYGLAARYEYPLSKRTTVYTGAGYGEFSVDSVKGQTNDTTHKLVQAYVDMMYRF